MVCQCVKELSAFVAMMTFLVTPGAFKGLHLKKWINFNEILPNNSSWHHLTLAFIKCVTAFAGKDIPNLNWAILFTSGNVFIMPVESHTECGLCNVTECILVSNFKFTILCCYNLMFRRAWWQIFFCLLICHHGCWKFSCLN